MTVDVICSCSRAHLINHANAPVPGRKRTCQACCIDWKRLDEEKHPVLIKPTIIHGDDDNERKDASISWIDVPSNSIRADAEWIRRR